MENVTNLPGGDAVVTHNTHRRGCSTVITTASRPLRREHVRRRIRDNLYSVHRAYNNNGNNNNKWFAADRRQRRGRSRGDTLRDGHRQRIGSVIVPVYTENDGVVMDRGSRCVIKTVCVPLRRHIDFVRATSFFQRVRTYKRTPALGFPATKFVCRKKKKKINQLTILSSASQRFSLLLSERFSSRRYFIIYGDRVRRAGVTASSTVSSRFILSAMKIFVTKIRVAQRAALQNCCSYITYKYWTSNVKKKKRMPTNSK